MPCTYPPEQLKDVVAFHGHNCPGLTIGIRAAELARRELGPSSPDLVAVSETDMCGVDAIQYLTDCTLGKGNLILKDYGKMAFSFYDRKANKGFRAALRDGVFPEQDSLEDMGRLMHKISAGTATPEEQARNQELRGNQIKHFLDLDLDAMFTIQWLKTPPPRPPRVLESLFCATCGEKTMETRTHRLGGQTYCIPCFQKLEQKQ